MCVSACACLYAWMCVCVLFFSILFPFFLLVYKFFFSVFVVVISWVK